MSHRQRTASVVCSAILGWATVTVGTVGLAEDANWPGFRGPHGRGVANGFAVRASWNADPAKGEISGLKWKSDVPGLGHSSPTIFGDKLFVATAIAASGPAPLKVGSGGESTAADDNGEQSWVVLCYDKGTGKELWRRTAWQGVPRATRHAKATHANTTVAVDGEHVVACFGSEGLHCYTLDGQPRWQRDLGTINISKYGIGWGYASSPALHRDRIALVGDDPQAPFVAVFRLSDGQELWRHARGGDCERSWGTPCIYPQPTGGGPAGAPSESQVVVNGWPWIVSYDLESGQELWRIRGGGDNPVPTPFAIGERIFITNAHGAESPIFVIRPEARGDLSPVAGQPRASAVVWSSNRGGTYLSTPVVYQDLLYLGNTNGLVRCLRAATGEKLYEKRLDSGASIVASLVAADDKIYCVSEDGRVFVLQAGPEFEIIARNDLGEPCFATPALSAGVLYFRTTRQLIAIQ